MYRQWPDQGSLLLATIQELTASSAHVDWAGPVEDDVRAALVQLRTRLVRRSVRSVYGALASRSEQDATFRDAQCLFVNQLMLPLVDALGAGVARGDLAATTDCAFEANLLAGLVLHCHLALHDDISDALIDEVIQRWQDARFRS